MKFLKILAWIVLALVIVYFFGPKPATPSFASSNTKNFAAPIASSGDELEKYVESNESSHKLKPDNEARIIWANDSLKNQTEYAIVYLHGFSASQKEGDPVHRNIAKTFGCNLYLSRLAEHGIDTTDQLINLTADNYWESVKAALAIGRQMGNKVILMGTSTGATQAIQLAAAYPDYISALVLYSPNIAIKDDNAWLLNNHWGLQIARLVQGSKLYSPKDDRPIYKQYWNKPYRLEALVTLEEIVETSMNKET